jgi:hypothetical protein
MHVNFNGMADGNDGSTSTDIKIKMGANTL